MDNSFVELLDVEKDSGMESVNSSKDETPERKTDGSQEEDYEDEPDETLYERLWGLTEMFPEPVRNLTDTVVDLSGKSVFTLYKFFCASSWIFFTSSMVLFAPIIFETERAQMEEMQKSQQKQILLGSAPGPGGMPPIPR